MTVRRRSALVTAVAKMAEEDEETAALFVQLSLFNTLADMIEEAAPVLEVDANAVIAKGAKVAREQLLANSSNMTEQEIIEAALAVQVLDAYVSKNSLLGAALDLFNRLHQRDQHGRFTRMDLDRASHAGMGTMEDRHRDLHNQAENKLKHLKATGIIDDKTPIKLHYVRIDPLNGKVIRAEGPVGETNAGRARSDMDINSGHDPSIQLNAISFDRGAIPMTGDHPEMRRAALDAMTAFASPPNMPSAVRLAQGLPIDQKGDRAQAEWNRPGAHDDRKIYRRMSLTGQALATATLPGSTANTVGNLARLVGNIGPEAEKVLAPGMRRTAYRYRGTEHRPGKDLVMANDNAKERYAKITENKTIGDDKSQATMGEVNGAKFFSQIKNGTDGATGSAGHWFAESRKEKLSKDQLWLNIHGDTAAISLIDEHRLPSLEAAKISLEAGELPPSVGVIIDADGDVVSEAQGYNGDHYLPFDLKNLKALQGGQYVRTRAAGGLTTEDLYTGLLTGARQVQVVSNSGVFTVEFDPDVRGGRRYTDKALRMINRYGKILETIQAGRIMRNDVPFARRQQLQEQAQQISRQKDRASVAQQYDRLLEEERTKLESPDEDELRQEATAQVEEEVRRGERYSPQQHAEAIDTTYQSLLNSYNARQVRRLNLDGQGYGIAQTSLHTEFPFFIRRVNYEPLPEFLRNRGQKPQGRDIGPRDAGYVERGQTNPQAGTRGGAPRYNLRKPDSIGDAATVRDRENAPAGQDTTTVTTTTVGQEEVQPLHLALAAGGTAARKIASKATRLVNPLREWKGLQPVDPAGFRHTDESAKELGALTYLYHRVMTEGHEKPEEFVNWLLKDATVEDRSKIAEGLDDLEYWVSSLTQASQNGALERMDLSTWGGIVATVRAAAEAGKPFADPVADMATAVPSVSNPLPQPFPAVVALGTDPDAYEDYLQAQDDDFKRHVDFLMGANTSQKQPLTDNEAAESIALKLEEYNKLDPNDTKALQLRYETETQQRAWSFVRGREIAEDLQDVLGGGATPKVHKRDQPSTLLDRLLAATQSHQPE